MPRRATARTAVDADIAPLSAIHLLAEHHLALHDVIDRRRVAVNLVESPLACLVRRDLTTAVQFAAGERLQG